MKMATITRWARASMLSALVILALGLTQERQVPGQAKAKPKKLAEVDFYDIADMATVREPKPLSATVKKSLAWLARMQNADGGWSAGLTGGPRQSDLSCSSLATIAFLRAGNSERQGAHKDTVARAIRFITRKVEAQDWSSFRPGAQAPVNTQVQTKIGPFADLFLANLALAELRGKAGEEERTVATLLEKTMNQVLALQSPQGRFRNNAGWAPVLAAGLANKGIARARIQGTRFDHSFCERAFAYSVANVLGQAVQLGEVRVPVAEDAGVALYRISQGATNAFDIANAYRYELARIRLFANDPLERDNVQQAAHRVERLVNQFANIRRELVNKLRQDEFLRGVGTIGGEELLSYWNVSELLVLEGGETWEQWDGKMSEILIRAQNADGSWSGQHCITGPTFCTAAALLVLLGDRTPFPREMLKELQQARR